MFDKEEIKNADSKLRLRGEDIKFWKTSANF